MRYMVVKQASPPTSWDTASAVNTPSAPIHRASRTVRGALTMALRSREKTYTHPACTGMEKAF